MPRVGLFSSGQYQDLNLRVFFGFLLRGLPTPKKPKTRFLHTLFSFVVWHSPQKVNMEMLFHPGMSECCHPQIFKV